jgi:hypothetical protein
VLSALASGLELTVARPSWALIQEVAVQPAAPGDYQPAYPGNWHPADPSTVSGALDQLSLSTAGGLVYDRSFCPPALLSRFANLADGQAAPPYLAALFPGLGDCQAAFPNCTKLGYLDEATFESNSLDWAVLQEAVAYCEQTPSLRTVWMQEGAYGIAGTITMTQGTQVVGQGSMGSGPTTGTGIAHFSDGDLFLWEPTDHRFTVNNDATGGGARSLSCWKANRTAVGGRSYGGGTTFHGVASDDNHRAGELLFLDILVASEAGPAPPGTVAWQSGHRYAADAYVTPVNGYYYKNLGSGGTSGAAPQWQTAIGSETPDNEITWTCEGAVALWDHHFFGDGSACTTPGGAGTRSWHFYKVRTSAVGTQAGSVLLDTVEHVHGSIQVDNGNSPDGYSGMTIQGDSNDIQLRLELQTFVIIQAGAAPSGKPACRITNVVNSPDSAPQVTVTVSPALPFGGGSGSANVNVLNAQATPSIDGFAVATFVTPGDTSVFTIPAEAPVIWTGGGTVQSTGPRSLTLDGKIDNVVIYNTDSTGCVNQTSDVVPGTAPVEQYAISESPHVRFDGQYPPAFRLALVDATSEALTPKTGVTGNGNLIIVPFNTLSYDNNGDFRGLSSPYTSWTCYCAGLYRVRARVCAARLSSLNTSMTLQIFQTIKAGGDAACTCVQNVIATGEGTYQVIEVEDTMVLNFGDSLEVRLAVGGSGKSARTAVAFGDKGSGLTAFSAELL